MAEDFLALFGNEPEVVTLGPGEALFEKGELGDFMYVVKSGEVQIIDGNDVYETVSRAALSVRWPWWMRVREAQMCAPPRNPSPFPSTNADS